MKSRCDPPRYSHKFESSAAICEEHIKSRQTLTMGMHGINSHRDAECSVVTWFAPSPPAALEHRGDTREGTTGRSY